MSQKLHQQFMQAVALHQQGKLQEAGAIYEAILKVLPRHPDALHLLGLVALQTGQYQRAADLIGKAIAINPGKGVYLLNRGKALQSLGDLKAAVASFKEAIRLQPDNAEAYFCCGNALCKMSRLESALLSYEKAIDLNSGYFEAHFNHGNTLMALSRFEDALASFDRALKLNNRIAAAHFVRGNALLSIRKLREAIDAYEAAIAIEHEFPEAWNNRGNALKQLGRHDEALSSYRKAIEIKEDYADAWMNASNVLSELKRSDEARQCMERAVVLSPQLAASFMVTALYEKNAVCDWRNYAKSHDELKNEVMNSSGLFECWPLLSMYDDPCLHITAARKWIEAEYPEDNSLGKIKTEAGSKRIRIGYFSADFREHPVAMLMCGVLKAHDRSKFESFAFSSGVEEEGAVRSSIKKSVDHFIDINQMSDKEVALLSRQYEIDIAVDLGGHTKDSRIGVFSFRAAPVQVGYLGYPGTTGADYMDYIVADPVIVSADDYGNYVEKVVTLPSYQPNDAGRETSTIKHSRQSMNLPESGFVFCCFNDAYKITPSVYTSCMNILKQVPGSVLWLRSGSQLVMNNLRNTAAERGVMAERVIFAERMPTVAEHLARHRLADLFLDTFPYNAHTTASDALWVGVPVLTRKGKTFAARVAASLLNSIGLPELVTESQEQYESLAIELAGNPGRLQDIKVRLEQNRLTAPLFNTDLYTRNLEAAYTAMYERYQSGLQPDHIIVSG